MRCSGVSLTIAVWRHAVGLTLLLSVGVGCKPHEYSAAPHPVDGGATGLQAISNVPADTDRELLREVTADVGFNLNPAIYPDGTYLTPEITPGGVALFDFDNDGLLDILEVCHPPPGPDQLKQTAANRLFRQDKQGRFVEVPGAAGLAGAGYHNGVAIGDIDNDGFPDVFIANYGSPDQLFHNNGDGTFTDITAKAGLPDSADPSNWTSTATFADLDGDGYLDLLVVHFAKYEDKTCRQNDDPNNRDYCGPHVFTPRLLTVYHNNGNGTFTDITAKLGITTPGRGWGIIAGDLTGSGKACIFQANDEEANQLWVPQADGTMADEALIRGCAFSAGGEPQANMGVTIGDISNRGCLDLFITHISSEGSVLLKDNGGGVYSDATALAGTARVDRPFTGWGCGLFDLDNDGNLDLAVADGRVNRGPSNLETAVGPFWRPFAEPNLLFKGDGTGHFTDVSGQAGLFASRREVHRALAFGDLQNRGAVDLVCVNVDNTIRVFRNNAAKPGDAGHHWLQVLPMIGKREALGARVTLIAGGQTRAALCLRGYSYISSNDPRVHFGLGKLAAPAVGDQIRIDWPSGSPRHELFEIPGFDRVLTLRQGVGTTLETPTLAQQ